MTQCKKFNPVNLIRASGTVVVAGILAFALAVPSEAQRRRKDDDEKRVEGRVLSTAVGEQILEAQTCLEAEDNACVLRIMDELAGGDSLSPYESFVIYQFRARAYFIEDRLDLAIRDFEAAINTGAPITDEVIALRSTLGQLHMVQENSDEAIRQFELAVEAGAELTPTFAKIVAQAYLQANRLAEGVRYAEIFYEGTPEKREQDFNLMFYFYRELDRTDDQIRVAREYLNVFPSSRTPWQNLVALYSQQNDLDRVFEVNKLMYLNSLLQEGDQLTRLAEYFSFFENPYRGGLILEREMNAGRIETSKNNLEILANMWRQAAEFDRAIPVLQRLSDLQGDGETALRLAEAHYQRNNKAEAETALEVALERGGLSDTGKAWELLGNIRFDLGQNQSALAAFREAARFPKTRSTSNGWIRFINGQIAGEARRERQREQILIDECRLILDAERRQIVLTGAVDAAGNVVFDSIPNRCQRYYNIYGEQIRELGWTDAQVAEREMQLQEIRETAAGIAG